MNKDVIGIIGLGYVGLPLAIEFSNVCDVIGFDINESRIEELNNCKDKTNEVNSKKIKKCLDKNSLVFTCNQNILNDCNIYIVTVPTPINEDNTPNLDPLIKATLLISNFIKKGNIIIYESTVYPGCTDEICVPILEKDGFKLNQDFFVGYSPERINPGDKLHTLKNITKLVSGSNEYSKKRILKLYNKIVENTYEVKDIKTAEAAKIIENTQRDINIAFVNELSMLFNMLKIDTTDVLNAASTKWNFLNFKPGLVGGHCIGVDPYYLAHKAKMVDFNTKMILSGRAVNNNIPRFISDNLIKAIFNDHTLKSQYKVLILGLTFKEDCPDVRNTKVLDIYKELLKYSKLKIDISDPYADEDDVLKIFKKRPIKKINNLILNNYDILIFTVNHTDYKSIEINKYENKIIFDIKNIFKNDNFWKL